MIAIPSIPSFQLFGFTGILQPQLGSKWFATFLPANSTISRQSFLFLSRELVSLTIDIVNQTIVCRFNQPIAFYPYMLFLLHELVDKKVCISIGARPDDVIFEFEDTTLVSHQYDLNYATALETTADHVLTFKYSWSQARQDVISAIHDLNKKTLKEESKK